MGPSASSLALPRDLPAVACAAPTVERATLALVDLDAFYVSVERRRDPSLRGRPVIVGGLPGSRGVVACASYEARGHGVHAGMPLSQAAALLPARCPRCVRAQEQRAGGADATGSPTGALETGCGRLAANAACPVFLAGDHEAYLEASRQVMAVLARFTPAVEPVSLDEAYLDFSGCERHHRSWLAAAEALRRAVTEATGLSISVGIGGTRAVAKVAAALAKPAGVLVVRPGEERAFLAALPLEHLPGIGPKTRAQLERFQLRTVGDLAALPDELLLATFGRLGPELARRARGEEDVGGARVGERVPKSRSISRETSFERDTDDPQVVDGMLSYLAQRAAHALRAEGLKARSVGVRLRYADFETVETRRRFAQPTDLDHDILEQVRALWPVRWTRRVRLRLVGVVLHDLEPAGERQLTLGFGAAECVAEPRAALAPYVPPAVDSTAIDGAVDRIRDRHGFGAVVRGRAISLLPARRDERGAALDAPRQRQSERAARSAPSRWTARGLRLSTPACSR